MGQGILLHLAPDTPSAFRVGLGFFLELLLAVPVGAFALGANSGAHVASRQPFVPASASTAGQRDHSERLIRFLRLFQRGDSFLGIY
jgi:hypothetical protein